MDPAPPRQSIPLLFCRPVQGTSPSILDDGHVESPQQQQQLEKESGAPSSSSSCSKRRKRKVSFADGVALEDGDSRQRLHKQARQLSEKHSFSIDAPEASKGAVADAERSFSGRTLRPRGAPKAEH
jgi:hypothetical protein